MPSANIFLPVLARAEKTDDLHTLSFKDGKLYNDGKEAVPDIEGISFSLTQKESKHGTNVLLWEAKLPKKQWIGGAAEVVLIQG